MSTAVQPPSPRSGKSASPSVRTRDVVLLIFDRFPLIPFSCLVDCMRTANRFAANLAYRWHLVSPDGRDVCSSSGVQVAVEGALGDSTACDRILLVATNENQYFEDEPTFRKLRALDRSGALLGSASSGSFVLARAGLLDGYRCTIHWENLPVFRELYPHLEITSNIYEIDRSRGTCSGGTAALDMMLKFVEQDCGHDMARRISQIYQHDRLRTPDDPQRMENRYDLIRLSPKLAEAIELMQNNIEDPLSPQEVAGHVDVSLRQLERLFRKYRDTTPQRYYLKLRLENARQLLLYTSRSGLDVAIASGFSSHSHFIKSYRDVYGRTPREERTPDTGKPG